MRRVFLFLVALSSLAAAAQSTPYRPLAVGNTWTFSVEASDYTQPTLQLSYYVVQTVLRDTTIAGADYAVLGCDVVGAASGSLVTRGRAAVSRAPGNTLVLSGWSICGAAFAGPAPGPTSRIGNPLTIGGTAYPMTSVAGTDFQTSGPVTHLVDYADPVGMVRYDRYSVTNVGSTSLWTHSVWTLDYAEVNGTTYGVSPVAGEAEPEAPSALALTASPSPTTRAVALRFAGADRATVSVYSATGRLVFAGEMAGGTRALDTRAWAPGVYVARAVAGGQAATARIVVAR